ncbi:hypothetical protein OEA41_004113 [Lepraria neglecta]|uniref:DUF7587 domain-containing protein n=1 Tax=Lepraria neglecta TaxID=209136 RepID=A0AAE0DJG2_9LECA|nr:hypothetical protein OEA41_004113 [Lepraria neglecta]
MAATTPHVTSHFLDQDEITFLKVSRRLIPRYLYRTYSARSRGFNNAAGFLSGASTAFPTITNSRVFNVPKRLARWEISQHLTWGMDHASHWISFTSSLLFALKMAQHLQEHFQDADVSICVIDTSALETEDIFPIRALFEVYNMPWTLASERDCHDEEYLAYDRLDTTAGTAVISMKRLLDHGLANYFPELFFQSEPAMLPIGAHVVALRTLNFATAALMTKEDLRMAETLAGTFAGVCVKPLVMAFLSLRLRYRNDEIFIFWVSQRFLDPRVLYNGITPDNTLIGSQAPELVQFINLISDRTCQLQALRLRYVTPKHYFFLLRYLKSFNRCHQYLKTWLATSETSQCATEVGEVFKRSMFHLREFAIAARISKRHWGTVEELKFRSALFAPYGYPMMCLRLTDHTASELQAILDSHNRDYVHQEFFEMVNTWRKWLRDFTETWSTPEQEKVFSKAALNRHAAENFFYANSPWTGYSTGDRVKGITMNTMTLVRREGEVITAPRGLPYRLTLANARGMTEEEDRFLQQQKKQ